VWAAPLAGKLYVVTATTSGKARRLGTTNRVRFAACNASGSQILSAWQDGTGRIVAEPARRDQALAALRRKYGWQLTVAMLVYRVRGLYRERTVLELTSTGASNHTRETR
jgi:PPOX class probable F420-dependent enzyme